MRDRDRIAVLEEQAGRLCAQLRILEHKYYDLYDACHLILPDSSGMQSLGQRKTAIELLQLLYPILGLQPVYTPEKEEMKIVLAKPLSP